MHIGRSRVEIVWCYYGTIIPNLATITIPVGGPGTGFNCGAGADVAPITDLPYFSLDVYTDAAVWVYIQTAHTAASLATMVTLTCGGVLQHNTVYDLPPPWNRDGYLIITGHWLRLQVENQTGGDVDPFELVARAWK